MAALSLGVHILGGTFDGSQSKESRNKGGEGMKGAEDGKGESGIAVSHTGRFG